MSQNGIILLFEGSSQRLREIQIIDFERLRIQYQDDELCSDETTPTIQLVYKLFGPTYPGVYDANKGTYTLSYPGAAFVFEIPPKHGSRLSSAPSDLPLQLPDGSIPVASKLLLFQGADSRSTSSQKIHSWTNASVTTEREIESAIVDLKTRSVSVHLAKVSAVSDVVKLVIGETTAQDLVVDLGSPLRVFYKQQDKMRIYGDQILKADSDTNDYFYNYFHLGMDILLDGAVHTVKKIILHGNAPGHFNFMRYKRCEWTLRLGSQAQPASATPMFTNSPTLKPVSASPSNKSTSSRKAKREKPSVPEDLLSGSPLEPSSVPDNNGGITSEVKFDHLQPILSKHFGVAPSPMILDRSASSAYRTYMRGSDIEAPSVADQADESDASPLAHTELYGYPGVIFEVMKNGVLATMMLV